MDGKFSRSRSEPDVSDVEDGEETSSGTTDTGANDLASKRERFRRLAESRTNKALSAIAIIGNLSNRHVYEYEDAEVRKIVKALREAVSAVEERFNAPKARAGARFKL
ncbi:hypothetical protein [Roseicella sp. DB1501]|uniref:hypothetical protein n=1 Tax=Roseicella sp. DB1501 TaxID=2730925 RepID=UPI001C2CACCC|nr:hypothetical protein [Roseicella sp. DB1501]